MEVEEVSTTITISDPKLIETLERVTDRTQFVRPDGTVIPVSYTHLTLPTILRV